MRLLKRLLMAASYVTCLHVLHVPPAETEEDLAGLSKYLPLVGMLIGMTLSMLAYLLIFIHANSSICGVLLAAAWLAFSNGLHFDGLMDTADGIFSHQSPQRMLEIMSDPRVGNFGVIVGFIVFAIKAVSLSSLPLIPLLLSLLCVPAWSRWCETAAIGCYPYVKEEGKGKIWHDTTIFPNDVIKAAIAPLLLVAAACLLGHWQALIVSLFTIASGLLSAHWLNAKLKGQTGDTYGAVVELSETGALLATALSLPGIHTCN